MKIKTFLVKRSREKLFLALIHAIYHKIFRQTSFNVSRVDKAGVPFAYYKDIGLQRNPVTVCNYAIKYYQEGDKRCFLNCVKWLVGNLSDKGNFSVWEYTFPWKGVYVTLSPPWVSGMAQGLGIKVFVLANKETGNEDFINLAFDALKSFTVPVKDGGVLLVSKHNGGYWYEEYASSSSIHSYVLNGHIFALEGIHDLYVLTKNNMAWKLFNEGCSEVKRHLYEYDEGTWTYYNRLKHKADWKYHNIHIDQMNYLWKITGDILFKKYCEKWKIYALKPFAKIKYE